MTGRIRTCSGSSTVDCRDPVQLPEVQEPELPEPEEPGVELPWETDPPQARGRYHLSSPRNQPHKAESGDADADAVSRIHHCGPRDPTAVASAQSAVVKRTFNTATSLGITSPDDQPARLIRARDAGAFLIAVASPNSKAEATNILGVLLGE